MSPETDPKELKVYQLCDKEFKITIIKMVNELRKMMNKMRISTKENKF